MLFQGLLIVANVVQFGVILAFLLGKPRPRHIDGWLHPGSDWRLDMRGSSLPPYTWHLGGVPYDVAPMPPPGHQCRAQTCTISRYLHHRDRCACGATRVGVYGQWLGRGQKWHSRSSSAS